VHCKALLEALDDPSKRCIEIVGGVNAGWTVEVPAIADLAAMSIMRGP